MCSIVEEDFGDEGGAHVMVEENEPESKTNICKKCNEKEAVAKLMCSSCFVAYIRHKFRAALGSTKIVRRHSNVIMYFTGGVESVCLAEMIKVAFEQESHKRLCFDMELIFVDRNCLGPEGLNPKCRFDIIQQVRKILSDQLPCFQCYYSSIASSSHNEISNIAALTLADVELIIDNERNFLQKFNLLQSVTSKQSFIDVMTTETLRTAATQLNGQYVFTSETSIDLANKLMENISLGRGSSVAHDVAFSDDRIEAVKFVRPLKDLTADEAVTYAKILDLKYLETESFGKNLGKLASIQNLTSKFIDDLQKNFPSTVSTVYRTCGKIAAAEEAENYEDLDLQHHFLDSRNSSDSARCLMCKSFLDHRRSETLFAIKYSSQASNDSKNLKSDPQEISNIKQQLCHGCSNIFIGTTNEDLKSFF